MRKRINLDAVIIEWQSKSRRMGCVSAANWLCKRRPDFIPKRLRRYTETGEIYEHVVCTNGHVVIDLASYADAGQPQTIREKNHESV